MGETSIDEPDVDRDELVIKRITQLVEKITPIVTTNKIADASIIKQRQGFIFIIIILVVSVIGFLAHSETIDGSAATGVLGAVVGYMFGKK